MMLVRLALPVRSPSPLIVPWTWMQPDADGGEGVGDAALGVVVRVNRKAATVGSGRSKRPSTIRTDLIGQGPAVGVAEGDHVHAVVQGGLAGTGGE